MIVPSRQQPSGDVHRGRGVAMMLRVALAALAGLAAALLVSCGGTNKALIPTAHAGPLLSDFEAVRNAAENADGNCSATEAALRKTEEDFGTLPATVDAGLRNNLHQGIDNLRVRAHELCVQPLAQSTGTGSTNEKTTSTKTETQPTTSTTTKTETEPPPTPSSPTVSTPTTPGPGGGTPAPGVGETPPTESEQGSGIGRNGGAGPEGLTPGGQEGGK
jgi:hypothetical protein